MSAPATTAVGGERRVRWLDSIPPDWTVVPSKWLFTHTKERARHDDEQLTASQDDGVIPQAEFMRRAGRQVMQVLLNREILKHVERDDFVISMRSFQGGLERSWAQGCISSAYVVLRPGPEVHVPFFAHLFKSTAYIQALQATSNLVRDGQALRFDNFCMVHLPRVPLPTQRAIAAFLDRKTAAIDALIEKKQKLLDLLTEKRAALINQAVTKGLDPSVPMKDSGVPWIGEIPAHWEVKRLKTVASFTTSGSRGWADYYTDNESDPVFLQSGNLGRHLDVDLSTHQRVSPPPGAEGQRTLVALNDVLVCITGARTGAVAVVTEAVVPRAYINQHVCLARLVPKEANPLFVGLGLSSDLGQAHFQMVQYGGTKQGLGLDDVRNCWLAFPPKAEQDELAQQVSASLERSRKLARRIEQNIERLQEYRQALITAAVTGQLDLSQEDN